jgi:hypothetical protein
MSKETSVLDIKFKPSEFGKVMTLREYCKNLLCTLWEEGEGFSGKRPFGNSDWDFNVFKELVKKEYVAGSIDEYGDLVEVDPNAAAKVITDAIKKEF